MLSVMRAPAVLPPSHFVFLPGVLLGILPLAACPPTFEEVEGFGSNPGALRMFEHLPERGDEEAAPLVLFLHGCGHDPESAIGAGILDAADRAGVILLAAAQRIENNPQLCFNWFLEEDIAPTGGEAESLHAMVENARERHAVDDRRIFVLGPSAGGAMAAVMLAVRPGLFAAGAIIAGGPYRCGTGLTDPLACMLNSQERTQADWAELVLDATNHDGPWPRVTIWHGEDDPVVSVNNADASALQWSGVHGLPATPDTTDELHGATRRGWERDGQRLVEEVRVPGIGHGIAVDTNAGCGEGGPFAFDVGICTADEVFRFFGLLPDAA